MSGAGGAGEGEDHASEDDESDEGEREVVFHGGVLVTTGKTSGTRVRVAGEPRISPAIFRPTA